MDNCRNTLSRNKLYSHKINVKNCYNHFKGKETKDNVTETCSRICTRTLHFISILQINLKVFSHNM